MTKIKVETELSIPDQTLIYDIGQESFVCNVCKSVKRFVIIDRPRCRDGSPSTEQAFKNFVSEHGQCLMIKHERRIHEDARQPCRGDYRDSQGHGPHECGKMKGHSGPCGP